MCDVRHRAARAIEREMGLVKGVLTSGSVNPNLRWSGLRERVVRVAADAAGIVLDDAAVDSVETVADLLDVIVARSGQGRFSSAPMFHFKRGGDHRHPVEGANYHSEEPVRPSWEWADLRILGRTGTRLRQTS